MMPFLAGVTLGAILSASAYSQAAVLEFEVASVKQSAQRPGNAAPGSRQAGGGCASTFRMDRGRIDIECATLAALIGYAYRLSPERVKGPDWMMSAGAPKFDIRAKLAAGASQNQVPEMLRALLAERFKLILHRATTDQAVYALVVRKGGPILRDASPNASDPDIPPGAITVFGDVQTRITPKADGKGHTTTLSNSHMGIVKETEGPNGIRRWEATDIDSQGLADLVDKVIPASSPIVDRTGLKGRYQFVLEVSFNDIIGTRRPDLDPENAEEVVLKAFNDGLSKLGLQLERRKGPLETLVIDHVDKAPAAN